MNHIVEYSVDHPKVISRALLTISLVMITLVALPSLWPQSFSYLNPLQVDTDPENMLPGDEPVRLYHDQMKHEFSLHDIIVLGVVNESNPNGVFNVDSLRRVYELTEYARTLVYPDEDDPDRQVGIVSAEMIAPSTVDNIEQAGSGSVNFEWLMESPPDTDEAALAIRDKARRIPSLDGTLLSEDGKALAIYLPITSKDISYRIANQLREKIESFDGDDEFYITGLPVSEDQFGVEMFIQMAICAPLAMLVVSLLMFYFFRKAALVAASMGVAMVAVIVAMGLLIATGNTLHIMSSMIPIFIMPIAVLDAIHILSEFLDRYQETRNQRETILSVMDKLFKPMLFTSLTTAVGFASLALTPIPPVQVFGLFVAIGVMVAWICSITFIPACIMFLKPERLENYGTKLTATEKGITSSGLARVLDWTGKATYRYAKPIVLGTALLFVFAGYGIYNIEINDNPVKWFDPAHEIRVADKVLNEHFGGTYMAYLALESQSSAMSASEYLPGMMARGKDYAAEIAGDLSESGAVFTRLNIEAVRLSRMEPDKKALLVSLERFAEQQTQNGEIPAADWDEALSFLDRERQRDQVFKQPGALAYIERLQQHLATLDVVGKSNAVTEIVKTVYRELQLGEQAQYKIPASADAVAQTMLTFQSSHRPGDLWHFVTPDYRKANIWVQLKSGDNRDMSRVIEAVNRFVKAEPPPFDIKHQWFGLNYINVVWQDKMVNGMVFAFAGSFIVVLFMVTLLYRSILWGMLCMIPLSVAITAIYGVIGLIGKSYDMPVAVLSALSLGLAVDYAIHFVTRTRAIHQEYGTDCFDTLGLMFGEPARAISRNAIVNGVGFLPLLIAPLVPYQTVGVFIAAILFSAGLATLVILPALISLLKTRLFTHAKDIQWTHQDQPEVIQLDSASNQ